MSNKRVYLTGSERVDKIAELNNLLIKNDFDVLVAYNRTDHIVCNDFFIVK